MRSVAAAANLAGWSEYQHKRVRKVSSRMSENLCVVYPGTTQNNMAGV